MSANSNRNFGNLIKQLSVEKEYEKAMGKARQRYQLSIFKIDNLTADKIAEMYYLITTKYFPFN